MFAVDKTSEEYKSAEALSKGVSKIEFGTDNLIPIPRQYIAGTNATHINVSVRYRKAGISFLNDKSYNAGYYLSIEASEVTELGRGFRSVGSMVGAGFSCLVSECARNTEKRRTEACGKVLAELPDILAKFIGRYGVKL